MTPRECGAVVKYMLAGFPAQRQRMRDEDVDAMTAFYFAGLQDLDAEVAKAAIESLGKTATFIPTVAEIRKAVGVVHHGEQSPALVGWASVQRAMHEMGAYRTPGVDFTIKDPIAAQAVRSIGWEEMCTGKPDHIRSRFLDAYAEIAKLERKEAALNDGGRSNVLGSRAAPDRLGRGATLKQLLDVVVQPCPECALEVCVCEKGPAR